MASGFDSWKLRGRRHVVKGGCFSPRATTGEGVGRERGVTCHDGAVTGAIVSTALTFPGGHR
jgi:hypothetical protein